MKTYTLDQLAYFTDHGMDRESMMRSMMALGLDEDASFALRSAESTRNRDVVRLYWDYGVQHGSQLEAVIDWQLAQEPENPRTVPAVGAPRYGLGELAWAHAVGLFQGDMARDMLALGIPSGSAQDLSEAAATHRTIIGVWREHGQSHAQAITTYLAKCLESYRAGWPHFSDAKGCDVEHGVDEQAENAPAL